MDGKYRLALSGEKLIGFASRSPRYHRNASRKLTQMRARAIQIFESQVKTAPENWRSSETSPPRYAASFRIERRGAKWILKNIDPGALWVEFGALAGGTTPVLKYRVFAKTVDSMIGGKSA